MAAVCCRLPVWGSRRPCDRAKMDACTMRVGKLQLYLLPSLSLASMLPNANTPTAKRTQRILTTPPVGTQLLSVLWGTWVQSTSINVKYYLLLYSVLLSIYRKEQATLLGRLPASSNPGNLYSSTTSVYLHSPQLAMSGLLRMKYTHTSNPSALSPSICVLLLPVRSSLWQMVKNRTLQESWALAEQVRLSNRAG